MRSFTKIKSSRIGEITLSFTDMGKSHPCIEFLTSQIRVLMLFTKITLSRKFSNLQYVIPSVLSSFAIVLLRKRELVQRFFFMLNLT